MFAHMSCFVGQKRGCTLQLRLAGDETFGEMDLSSVFELLLWHKSQNTVTLQACRGIRGLLAIRSFYKPNHGVIENSEVGVMGNAKI